MNQKEQLQQSLLELHYGLLNDAEAKTLRSQIDTDPDVARLWAETLEIAGQFASAASLADVPSVNQSENKFVAPTAGVSNRLPGATEIAETKIAAHHSPSRDQNPFNNVPQRPDKTELLKASKRFESRLKNYRILLGTIAAIAALMMVATVGQFLSTAPARPAIAVRIEAESIDSGDLQPNDFRFFTSKLLSRTADSAQGIAASLALAVKVGDVVVHRTDIETNSLGVGTYKVPRELKLPKNAVLEVSSTQSDSPLRVPLQPTRCLTYLTIDKPVYRPGEAVHYRSLTLERYSFKPASDLPIRFEMFDPSGAPVSGSSLEGVTERGVGNGELAIPESASGGTYTLKVISLDGFFPEESREIQVRNYRTPRFKKDLEFQRRSYGPGDEVGADFEAIRAEGGPVAKKPVVVVANVDGKEVHRERMTTDSAGTCAISFKLPDHISVGDGQLIVTIDDGGTQEVQSKTIPIQIGRVDVEFFPEGGYLIDGISNRVYFTTRNPLGDPIHIAGEILDEAGKQVAKIETVRDGMGRFEFTPKLREKYWLKVTDPVAIHSHPKLPKVVDSLPVLNTGNGVFANDENLKFEIKSQDARSVTVEAACRGQLVAAQTLDLKPGTSSLEIALPAEVEGVVRLTVLENKFDINVPLVERLIFREGQRRLSVSIDEASSQLERAPGEAVSLTLSVVDEKGEPAPAVLGIAVVDDAALSLREDGLPDLQTHFVLTSEINRPEDLEHANFYTFGSDESRESLDLLLGTQGWRRFVTGRSSTLALSGTDSDLSFNEQLARLIQLDGPAEEKVSIATVDSTNDRWESYLRQLSQHRSRLISNLRWFVLPFVVFGLIVILLRPKMKIASHLGMWLAIAMSCAIVGGCGSSEMTTASANKDVANESVGATTSDPFGSSISGSETTPEDEIDVDANGPDEPKFALSFPTLQPPRKRSLLTDNDTGDWLAGESEGGPGGGMGGGGRYANNRSRLQQILKARGLDAGDLAEQLLEELRFPVREYAHQHVSTTDNVREDFAETLYWQPLLITDSQGKAEIRFELSDSVTTFRVHADAHTSEGRLGTGGGEVVSRLPMQIEPKLPLAVTNGDRIDLPVAVINATNDPLSVGLKMNAGNAFKLNGPDSLDFSLLEQQRTRGHFTLDVVSADYDAETTIELDGTSGDSSLADSIRKSIKVSPSGYPIRESVSGVLNEKISVMLPLSTDAVPGSLVVNLKAYPSPLADLTSGMESILREPHGCFEQTSTTNYPNTMVLQYLQATGISSPATTRKAKGLLTRGYGKLVSFECAKLGFEWFGDDPGHEALSAFGLMQFTDMGKVMEVDQEMMTRTRKWLMTRRTGEGGFHRNSRHRHQWSVQQPIVDAYVLWALSEADVAAGNPQRGVAELAKELNQLNRIAKGSDDAYLISLAAATMINVKRMDDGNVLLEKLVKLQKDTGELIGDATVTNSGGISLKAETTSLAILAWSKQSANYQREMNSAVMWLAANRQGSGGFGSTQATVLALKALVAFSKSASTDSKPCVLYVKQNDKVIGQVKIPAEAKSGSTIELNGLGEKLDPNVKEIELVADGISRLPFSIEVVYHSSTPASDDRCPFGLATSFTSLESDSNVASGDSIRVEAVMKNKTDQGQPMTLITIGLPGGVEPRVEQLDELKKAGAFDFYEIRPREVTCYWRTIAPNEAKKVSFDVTAEVPGKYTGPASRAYLYYTAEQKVWTKPLVVEIAK